MSEKKIDKMLSYSYKELVGVFLIFVGAILGQFANVGWIGGWGNSVGTIVAIVGWIKVIKNGFIVLKVLYKEDLD